MRKLTLSQIEEAHRRAAALKQRDTFVHDAIARSLLTLPFAAQNADDPFGKVYGYYKLLLEASTALVVAAAYNVLAPIVEMLEEDIAIHEAAGNLLKAAIERQWCAGLQLYFAGKV